MLFRTSIWQRLRARWKTPQSAWVTATTKAHIVLAVLIMVLALAIPWWNGRTAWWEVGISRYTAWDANTYLKIATHGYLTAGEQATFIAFYPLWPAMIAILSGFGSVPKLAVGILLALGFSWIGHRWLGPVLEEYLEAPVARRVWSWFLLSPIVVYFFFPYTESLFLALTTLCFWFLYDKKPGSAAVMALLAAFTRLPGLTLVIPLAIVAWRQRWPWHDWWLVGLPFVSFACYLVLNWAIYANPFYYQDMLRTNWYKYPVNPITKYVQELNNWPETTKNLSKDNWSMWFDITSTLALPPLVLVYVAAVWWSRDKKIPWEWVAWTLAQGVLIWSQSYWLSSARYVWIGFPVFVMLERVTRWSRLLQVLVEVSLAGIAAWGIWLFATGAWIY